jgi:hypothetical protein
MARKVLLGLLLLSPLGAFPFLRDTNAVHTIPDPPARNPLPEETQVRLHAFGMLPGQSFPGCVPWESLRRMSADQSREMDELAKTDAVKLLERGLERYKAEVHGYRCTFAKQERVNNMLRDHEVIRANFRESPFSVHMEWKEGYDLCFASMYVAGENDGRLMARSRLKPTNIRGPVLTRPLDADDVKATSRFGIDRFGMYMGAKDTLDAIHAAQKAGTLSLTYHGIESVEKAGNRLCYKFVRTPYTPPEAKEGINELTIFIDRATLLQVGSILKDVKGEFIAEYFFRDIELNPTFADDQFTRKKL